MQRSLSKDDSIDKFCQGGQGFQFTDDVL